jgi:hypothetical protein
MVILLSVNNQPLLLPPSLFSFYNDGSVNRVNGLSTVTAMLPAHDLEMGYFALRNAAPRRHHQGKVFSRPFASPALPFQENAFAG